jgi:hypothetical protein
MIAHESFKMFGLPVCHGQNLLLMRRGWRNTLHARFVDLLKGKKKCLRQSWIAYLNMLDVEKLRFLC